jgi:hypothetical protein
MLDLIMASLLFASLMAFAETKPTSYVICKNNSQVRTIRIELDAENICHTIYSKQGSDKQVGSGKNKSSCDQWLANVRVNLEKSGWKCRDVESATVESSN